MTSKPEKPSLWPILLLAVAAFAAYWGSFGGPFVYDDLPTIRDNTAVHSLWPNLGGKGVTTSGRPVLAATFALNYAVGGTSVLGYHAVNLLIHILAGLLLFGIVRRTLAGVAGPFSGSSVAIAFASALLWELHPLQTESVAYIVQRAESLMGLFYLLTLYAFVRASEPGPASASFRWLSLSFLSCLAGMGTKEVMVCAPLTVFLYDRAFVAGSFRAAWAKRRSFYLALAATWIPLGVLVAATGANRGGTSGFGSGIGWGDYLLTQCEAITRYLGLTVWPSPLVFEYGPIREQGFWPLAGYATLILCLLAGTLWALVRKPAFGFLGAWFFLILAPTSLVPGGLQMIAEHRMYLALAPAALACGLLGRHRIGLVACAVLATGLGWATAGRVSDYRSDLALWGDTAAKRPDNARARTSYGDALRRSGRIADALRECAAAVQQDPEFAEARVNFADVLLETGRLDEAKAQLQESLRLKPGLFPAHVVLGGILVQQGQVDEGLAQFHAALRLESRSFLGHYNFGNALFQLGRVDEAASEYAQAIAIDPNSFEARYNGANALAQLGRNSEAIAQYEAALKLKPDVADAHFNFAGLLARSGRINEAIVQYQAVLRINPADSGAQQALAALGRGP